MRIQHNIAALNSYRNLGTNNTGVSKNLEKLSSGYRINRAGDDAAGLAISEKMRSQITGLNTATKNANDGISLVQTAEGALTEVHSMLNRMVEIATQSSNGVYEDAVDRAALQDEMNALTQEIDRIADGTNFNKKNLLNGDIAKVAEGAMSGAAAAGNNTASVKLNVEFASLYKDHGLTIDIVSDGKSAAQCAETVSFTAGGSIQVTLNANKDYTASDITKMIKDAARNNDTVKADTAFKDAINGMSMTGNVSRALQDKKDNVISTTQLAGGTLKVTNNAMNLQIGDTNAKFNKLEVAVRDMHASKLGLDAISVSSEKEAGAAIDVINEAINTVSSQRGRLGAVQNRLEHTINNLSVNAENMTAAESRIRDVDMAKEMMDYTKNNILVQASQAMLAQANQVPQGVLQLLQ